MEFIKTKNTPQLFCEKVEDQRCGEVDKYKRTKALKAKKCCHLLDNAKGKERSSLPVSVKECTLTDP